MTVARGITDTFAGIAPNHVVPFILAQFAGALTGMALSRWLLASATTETVDSCAHDTAR